jgi:hypothetical protein
MKQLLKIIVFLVQKIGELYIILGARKRFLLFHYNFKLLIISGGFEITQTY